MRQEVLMSAYNIMPESLPAIITGTNKSLSRRSLYISVISIGDNCPVISCMGLMD